MIVGLAYVLIVRPLLKLAARPPQKLEQRDSTPAGGGTDLDSLMSALQNQALELRGQHASAVSSLSLDFDASTIVCRPSGLA